MDPKMSQSTRSEVLAKPRDTHARAGTEPKTKSSHKRVELFEDHRKAALRVP